MSTHQRRQNPDSKRAANACQRCRNSKLKCSGTQPCDRCRRRNKPCVYDDKEKRVLVSETYLENLRRAAGVGQGNIAEQGDLREPLTHVNADYDDDDDNVRQQQPNPDAVTALTTFDKSQQSEAHPSGQLAVTESPAYFLKNKPNKRRRWLYLGTSSTWSFNIRAVSIIKEHVPRAIDDSDENAFTLDGDAYRFSWNHVSPEERPDLSRLPSLDFAIYLTNTLKFHLGGILRLFNEEVFLHHLHEFYAEAPEKVGSSRLWYTQYLLVLAFGKGFLNNATRTPGSLSGSEYFTRAMAILPVTSELHEDPTLAVEVLAMISLYFYCLDMRQTAYSYIGQAMRIALVEGMHTRLPADLIGGSLAERCTNIWWTIYILDRTLSSAVGAPPTVHDQDIKSYLAPPRESSQRSATLSLHVKISRLISQILSELYSADGSLELSYLSKVRSVLRRMAEIAEELEGTINFKFKSSLETLSKGATHLRLLYHQCIILAIRPLILCLLHERMRNLDSASSPRSTIATSIRELLQTCADSAVKTLSILSALAENNMLDSFLPFDLEFTSSATSVLIILDEVLKIVSVGPSIKRRGNKILQEMKQRGSVPAQLRENELNRLGKVARRLWSSTEELPRVRNDSFPQSQYSDPDEELVSQLEGSIQTAHRTTSQTLAQLQGHVDGTALGATGHHSHEPLGTAHLHPPSSDMDMQHQFRFQRSPMSHSFSTPSQISTLDLAAHFDLSQEQMLLVADQLNVDLGMDGDQDDLLFSGLDFGGGGNWVWSSS